jgi:hypothetical protein
MRRDFELLARAAKEEKWTDKTPVPPEFLGPLWPDGEPAGWPQPALHEGGEWSAVLRFEVPEEMDPEVANQLIAELLGHMSQRNIELGGTGFQVRDMVGFIPAPSLVPAGCGDEAEPRP